MRPLLLLFIVLLPVLAFAQQQDVPSAKQIEARADHLRKNKNYEEAIREYNYASIVAPQDASPHLKRAICYQALNDHYNAVLAAQKAISLHAELVPAYQVLARSSAQQGNLDAAVRALNKAFILDSDHKRKVSYKVKAAELLFDKSRYKEAMAHVREVRSIDELNPSARYMEAYMLNRSSKNKAARDLLLPIIHTLHGNAAKKAPYYYELGYAYSKLGEYEEAEKHLAHAEHGSYKYRTYRLLPHFYIDVAESYLRVFDLKKTQRYIDTVLMMERHQPHVYQLMAELNEMKTPHQKSIELYRLSLSTENPNWREAYKDLSRLLMGSEAFTEALGYITYYDKMNPGDVEMQQLQAIAEIHVNQPGKATVTLRNLLLTPGLTPEQKSEFHYLLGRAYAMNNEIDKAQLEYSRATSGIFRDVALLERDQLNSQ